MYVQGLAVQVFVQTSGWTRSSLPSICLEKNSHMAPLQVPTVSFFDDCFLKTGVVSTKELSTIAFILDCGELKVTVEDLQPHVAAMHPNGECVLTAADMQQLF